MSITNRGWNISPHRQRLPGKDLLKDSFVSVRISVVELVQSWPALVHAAGSGEYFFIKIKKYRKK